MASSLREYINQKPKENEQNGSNDPQIARKIEETRERLEGKFKNIREKAKKVTGPAQVNVSSSLGSALKRYLMKKNEPKNYQAKEKSVKYIFNLKETFFGDFLPTIETVKKMEEENQKLAIFGPEKTSLSKICQVFDDFRKNPSERTLAKPKGNILTKMDEEEPKIDNDLDIFDDVDNDLGKIKDPFLGKYDSLSQSIYQNIPMPGQEESSLFTKETRIEIEGASCKKQSVLAMGLEERNSSDEDLIEADEEMMSKLGVRSKKTWDQQLNSNEQDDFYMECFPVGQEGDIGERIDPSLIAKGKNNKKNSKKKNSNWGNQLAQINKVKIIEIFLMGGKGVDKPKKSKSELEGNQLGIIRPSYVLIQGKFAKSLK